MRKITPDMMKDEVQKMDSVAVVMGTPAIWLLLDMIRMDGGTQSRAEINQKVVDNYAEAMRNGDEFKPIKVRFDGKNYWLFDGFHRVLAAKKVEGKTTILTDVRQGTQRDAILDSLGVNSDHGLQRTDDDKRRATLRVLEDPEWSQWSDREIGRRCNVSPTFVATLRKSYLSTFADSAPVEPRKVERNGSTYTMNTAKIGIAPFKSEWAPLTWAVYDWATMKAGQPIQSLKDIQYFKEKDQKWPRLTNHLKVQGLLDADKGSVLTACSTVLRALREDKVPQRISDTESVCPDTEPEPVMMMPEPVAVRIGLSAEAPVVIVPDLVISVEAETIPAGGWVGKSKPIAPKPSTNGAKSPVVRAIIFPVRVETNPGPNGSKLVVFHTATGDVIPVSLLPEQASWLAGELLS